MKSAKRTVTMQPRKTTKRRDFNNPSPVGLTYNGRNITKLKDVFLDSRQWESAEYAYLRENELQAFDPYIELPNLKILDLSMNQIMGSINFLHLLPSLRHLYVTGNKISTLEGVCGLQHLETLCASDNDIASFAGLDALPNLRVLSLNFNRIASFELFPHLPMLYSLNLVGNDVASLTSYRQMAIALCGSSLQTVDDTYITDEERAAVQNLRGKVVYCISEGFLIEGENVEEAADLYMLQRQRILQKGKPLLLHSIMLSSNPTSAVLTEGIPVNLSICMQDIRAYSKRTSDVFISRYLFPVTFKVCGDASEVFVVGTINGWGDPLPLERCEDGGEVFFQAMLYLPSGDYEYRYIVDGQEKVSDQNKVESAFKQGMCNIYHVTESNQWFDDDQDTILHIRWMRSDENNGFNIIENENALSYVPTLEDVNFCLRAEVLAYVDGDFCLNYFDISSPITAGLPECTRLEIKGDPVEHTKLVVEADYVGGREGESTLSWFLVDADDNATPLKLEDPWDGYMLQLSDVGKRIRIEFVPIRDDWTAGKPVIVTTPIIVAGIPQCTHIHITGEGMQGKKLVCETSYTGGIQGASRYQWFRHDETTNEFFSIINEASPEYVPVLADVGKMIAVEYTPVSNESVEGERYRCILDYPITPAPPEIVSIAIRGELEEGHVVVVDYEYFGGVLGYSHVQWQRQEGNKTVKVGRPNTSTYSLTSADVGSTIEVTVVPVRSDGVEGKCYSATSPEKVRAAKPHLQSLEISGTAKPGERLTAQVTYVGGDEGNSIICWSRSINDGSKVFETKLENEITYLVEPEDAGRMIRLSYTPVRSDGVQGETLQRLVHVPMPGSSNNMAEHNATYVDPCSPRPRRTSETIISFNKHYTSKDGSVASNHLENSGRRSSPYERRTSGGSLKRTLSGKSMDDSPFARKLSGSLKAMQSATAQPSPQRPEAEAHPETSAFEGQSEEPLKTNDFMTKEGEGAEDSEKNQAAEL